MTHLQTSFYKNINIWQENSEKMCRKETTIIWAGALFRDSYFRKFDIFLIVDLCNILCKLHCNNWTLQVVSERIEVEQVPMVVLLSVSISDPGGVYQYAKCPVAWRTSRKNRIGNDSFIRPLCWSFKICNFWSCKCHYVDFTWIITKLCIVESEGIFC